MFNVFIRFVSDRFSGPSPKMINFALVFLFSKEKAFINKVKFFSKDNRPTPSMIGIFGVSNQG